MELQTSRLSLSEITPDDLNNYHRLLSIPEVDEYNTLGILTNIDESRKLMEYVLDEKLKSPRSAFEWKILDKESGTFIGLAGLVLSNDKYRLGEIYYKFSPEHWGNGYATEVAQALVKAGFEIFNLHKVEAGVAVENVMSIRVLEKIGMTREGLRRKILPIRGKWVDNYHYAIVEDDPRNY